MSNIIHNIVGDIDVGGIVRRTPAYVYFMDIIKRQYDAFVEALPANATMYYAIMANDNLEILRWFERRSVSFFIGSWGHLNLMKEHRIPRDRILSGIIEDSHEAIKTISESCSSLLLGSLPGLQALATVKKDVEIFVRVNVSEPEIPIGQGRQLGFPSEIVRDRWHQWTSEDSRILGLHSYSGTNVQDYEELGRRAMSLCMLAESIEPVSILDFGGGFGIEEDSTGEETPLSDFWNTCNSKILNKYILRVEPGRFLVGPAGIFVTRVVWIDERQGLLNIGVDSSVTQFPRRLLFGAPDSDHPVSVIGKDGRQSQRPLRQAVVVGNTTYSKDVLFHGEIPEVAPGDYLIFSNAGAYCCTGTPRFLGTNHPQEIVIF